MTREIELHLIEKACNGDERAFSEIYQRLKDPLFGFALRMTRQIEIAEEITHDVFMFWIANPSKYRPELGSLKAFLCGVARNKIMNHMSKSSTRLEHNQIDETAFELIAEKTTPTPLGLLLDKEFAVKFDESLALITTAQREVFILREIEGLSYESIARIVEEDVATIKARLFRARRAVGARLSPYINYREGVAS